MIDGDPQTYDRVLSSMCTPPHEAARDAANTFLAANPGDPATFPTIADIERDVVFALGEIAGLDDPHGYVTGGGTEANIQAVHSARNRLAGDEPNIVVPANGHFSFRKAAALLDVEYRESPLDDMGRADSDAMADRVDDETVLVVGVAGSTEFGRVDPIPSIADLADDYGIHCHVDAAWGGFILPFTDAAWSFADAPIDSLTIDPHKFGRAAIPAGGLLARSPEMLTALEVETPYLESSHQVTLSGTRSGAGVASAAAAIDALWPDGYRDQFERAMDTKAWLVDAFADRSLNPSDPPLPLVTAAIDADRFETLREQGWRVSTTSEGRLRIVCMPHVTRPMLQDFLADFDAA